MVDNGAMRKPRAHAVPILGTGLWIGALLWAYDGPPPGQAWMMFALPGMALAGILWFQLAVKGSEDLSAPAALGSLLVVGALAVGGASWLRDRQEVAPADLARLFLDRRADATGLRPLSNLRCQTVRGVGEYRFVNLDGRIANDNDFPVWEVEVELRLSCGDASWAYPLVLKDDIPAHGITVIRWAHRFGLEEIPPTPAWEVKVLRARRHWGGGPRPGGN